MAQAPALDEIILPIAGDDRIPQVRKISLSDLADSLRKGLADFRANPTHALFLVAIYPVIGLLLARAALGYEFIPIIYPLVSGFALLGPFAAIGLYEMSRRRELGGEPSWRHFFTVFYLPTTGTILLLGCLLIALFLVWIAVADAMYVASFGYRNVTSLDAFLHNVFMTPEGHELILLGNLAGLGFAVIVLSLTVVSFPLLLDRDVSLPVAMATSVKAVMTNPIPMAAWGLLVAAGLAIGALPALLGLAVVIPVLGHATWHLYRKIVAPPAARHRIYTSGVRYKRFGAQFPWSLFAASSIPDDDKSA